MAVSRTAEFRRYLDSLGRADFGPSPYRMPMRERLGLRRAARIARRRIERAFGALHENALDRALLIAQEDGRPLPRLGDGYKGDQGHEPC